MADIERILTELVEKVRTIVIAAHPSVEKATAVSIFIKSVRGMMHALALDRPDIELIEDYGMLGIHNIRAVNGSLTALEELEAVGE